MRQWRAFVRGDGQSGVRVLRATELIGVIEAGFVCLVEEGFVCGFCFFIGEQRGCGSFGEDELLRGIGFGGLARAR